MSTIEPSLELLTLKQVFAEEEGHLQYLIINEDILGSRINVRTYSEI